MGQSHRLSLDLRCLIHLHVFAALLHFDTGDVLFWFSKA